MGLLDRIFRHTYGGDPRVAEPGHAPDMTPEEVGPAVGLGLDGKPMQRAELSGGDSGDSGGGESR